MIHRLRKKLEISTIHNCHKNYKISWGNLKQVKGLDDKNLKCLKKEIKENFRK